MTIPGIIQISWFVHRIGERDDSQPEKSRFEHLGDEIQGDSKQLFHSHQVQNLLFQGRSLQFCLDCPIRFVSVFEFGKCDRHVEQILLCFRGVDGLP
ncbi:hypothetical protein [Tychonema sp. LEGE 07203]|uniref:hypothetical protein n=1 Tax=Tychonema sp. LEGE 07203 TaxID=1828671 RepID=UPI001881FE4B|nr:hypothetical protein [Tychonema sp. LEGE 07203]